MEKVDGHKVFNEYLESAKKVDRDKTFHYTNEQMVKDLIDIIPYNAGDSFLDAGSGKNKVWSSEILSRPSLECFECELEDGCNFYDWNKKVAWIIGNPPFHEGWKFTDKASTLAQKGIAFLGNLNFWNSCLPSRFEILKERGFYLQKIHIVQDKRWFGRYYFLIFTKEEKDFLSWNAETYK